MIPQEELILIDDIIVKNKDLPKDDIIILIGEGYYKIYKAEIDNLISKYKGETYFDDHTMKIIR